VSGAPLLRDTANTVATFVGRVDFQHAFAEERTVFANVLPADRWWSRIARPHMRSQGSVAAREFARQTLERVGLSSCADRPVSELDPWRRRRLAIAQAMIPRRDHLVAPEVDEELSLPQAADALGVLRTVARSSGIPVFVSAADATLVQLFADRVLVLADGVLAFDGPPHALGDHATPRQRALMRAG